MKQTAVEWLNQKLRNDGFAFSENVLNKALEMEKQHIIDAVNHNRAIGFFDEDAEKYYNETYKNNL
jgi:hypothetical protein